MAGKGFCESPDFAAVVDHYPAGSGSCIFLLHGPLANSSLPAVGTKKRIKVSIKLGEFPRRESNSCSHYT